MLRLEVQNSSHASVVRCRGRIVRGEEAAHLLRVVMSQDKKHIQIDLSEVSAIDAGGLGALVTLLRWARDTGRTIQLVNPASLVREVLEATGLGAVFQILPPTQQAHQGAEWTMPGPAAIYNLSWNWR